MIASADALTLLIPALNEEAGVGPTVARARRVAGEVIVIDGGSEDQTVAEAEAAGARVVVEPRRGYGQAYMRGFEEVRTALVATADADGTYPVEVVPQVAGLLEERGLSFVSCSRFPLADRRALPLPNRLGNAALSLAAGLLYGHRFRDVCSGMWVLRRELVDRMTLRAVGWNFSNEIKLEALHVDPHGFAEVSVPFEQRLGETHNVTRWRTGVDVLGFMVGLRLAHARGRGERG
jgi:glycosyltransferase involved in cell wall biosynthesis